MVSDGAWLFTTFPWACQEFSKASQYKVKAVRQVKRSYSQVFLSSMINLFGQIKLKYDYEGEKETSLISGMSQVQFYAPHDKGSFLCSG